MRKIGRLMLPAIFGSSVSQVALLLDTLIASFLATGSIAWRDYADRLVDFPLGVLSIALASVILPIPSTTQGAEAIATMIDRGVRSAVAEAGLAMTDIHGIGVGVPGFIDSRAGVSRWSPILGDEPVAFAQMLQGCWGRKEFIFAELK